MHVAELVFVALVSFYLGFKYGSRVVTGALIVSADAKKAEAVVKQM